MPFAATVNALHVLTISRGHVLAIPFAFATVVSFALATTISFALAAFAAVTVPFSTFALAFAPFATAHHR
jgi:hypothetical protein